MTNLVTGRPNRQYMVMTLLIVDESDRKKLIQSSLAGVMTCGIHMKKKLSIPGKLFLLSLSLVHRLRLLLPLEILVATGVCAIMCDALAGTCSPRKTARYSSRSWV